MSFSFGFENDDIEDTVHEVESEMTEPAVLTKPSVKLAKPELHNLRTLLKALPPKISYSTIEIPGYEGIPISIPRRELFDIRAQLMTEDQSPGENNIPGLSMDDITPNIYEGGFKTWECSIDLADFLLTMLCKGYNPREKICQFVELGAGTALPTLILFDYFLRHPSPAWRAISFLLADYNTSVLETTTVPNLLLTWHFAHSTESLPRVGDLEITEDLLDHFLDALSDKAIFIEGISGAWGDKFCSLMQFEAAFNGSNHRPDVDIEILCLASETIYSPSSIRAFTEVLIRTLRGVENLGGKAKALIAAKCVYFGVGGGVDEFLKVLGGLCGRATPVWESTDPGVGRVILEMMTDDTLLDKDGLPPFPRR